MLSQKHLTDVCMHHSGAKACRFLATDDVDPSICFCIKKVAAKQQIINLQVDKFIKKVQADGRDPMAQSRPLGDNCKGYPALRTVKQGYDIDGGPK